MADENALNAKKKIYWLASYPKSGNTWIRILLTNYLSDAEKPASINALTIGSIASNRHLFDQYLGVESSDLTEKEVEQYRPLVYTQIADKAREPLYIKVHDARIRLANGSWLFPAEITRGVIYMVRNPLDVVISFAHHNGISIEKTVEFINNPGATSTSGKQGIELQLQQKVLSWSQHVESWLDARDIQKCVVRYEDLLRDPVATLARVIEFLGLDLNPLQVAKSVEFSTFQELQKQETLSGFTERPAKADRFFRYGRSEEWREVLSDELQTKIINCHASIMRKLGYL